MIVDIPENLKVDYSIFEILQVNSYLLCILLNHGAASLDIAARILS